jgi:hypothetical protein
MLVLTLIVWQTLGLPEVEDPVPDRIGLGLFLSLAGAGGVLGGILSVRWPQRREWFISWGTFVGFCIGGGLYALSLLAQLLFN